MVLSTQEMRQLIRFVAMPEIREAEETDAEALMRYANRIAAEPVNNTGMRHGLLPATVEGYRDLIREHRRRDNWVMFVADAEDRLAGMARLTGGTSLIDHHDAELHVNIDPDYRGMGLGSLLIEEALAWARENPMLRRVHLYVMIRNEAAARLYQRHGFALEGLMQDAIYLFDEGKYTDTLLMALPVK